MLLPTRARHLNEDEMGGFELASLRGAHDEEEETHALGIGGVTYGGGGGEEGTLFPKEGGADSSPMGGTGDIYGLYDENEDESWATTPTTTSDDISSFFKKGTADDEI
jgi:hypothetical protein